MREEEHHAGTRHGIAALLLCGLVSLPLAAPADTPVADSSARVTRSPELAQPSGNAGDAAAHDAGGDWDGLVTLVVSYLESTPQVPATVAFAEPAT